LKLRIELVAELSAVTSRFTCEDLMERLSNVKVNVAKVQNIGEAADHEQLAAVGGVVTYERQGKLVKTVASPFMMSSTPASVRRPAPELGEHTKEVLADFGISPDEIETFGKAGAFGSGTEK
jgi:crotonobetainyl-CoA:carnitine CoA-transferase CaiB-like acyl-CoA transferase